MLDRNLNPFTIAMGKKILSPLRQGYWLESMDAIGKEVPTAPCLCLSGQLEV